LWYPDLYACTKGRPAAFQANYVSVPISAFFDLTADPNGFSRAALDAVGVGRREALGVRQLAAALFFWHKQRVCPEWRLDKT